jgi:Two component regulator propeller
VTIFKHFSNASLESLSLHLPQHRLEQNGGLCLLVATPSVDRPIVARKYATKDGLGCVRVVSLYESADGRIWIGTDCGLAELLPGAGAELTLNGDSQAGRH